MVHEIIIPVMDQATETVLLTAWRKNEGQMVQKGEVICEIETEKATIEIEAGASGVLRMILVEASNRIPPRTVIGLIAEASEPLPDLERYRHAPAATLPPAATPQATAEALAAEKIGAPGERVIASPRARRLAEEHGIDLRTVRGSRPDGRIQEDDVRQAIEAAKAPGERVARAKAERVSQSWRTIPHFYTTLTVDMSHVAARKARASPRVTYTDFIALGICRALGKYPALNGHWKDEALVIIPEIHLGLVVQTERGLLMAVLPDLCAGSLESLATKRERMVQQALGGKFEAALGEPTFSLSNIGAGHIDHFTALISPPQVAILSVGSIQPRPVVTENELAIRPTASFTLGADHRAIDGREAAAFLEELKAILEAAE
jgi:pyruvate dehydrogenase E2 component (dihydrolipoamide acetyltransferase)